MSNPVCMGRPLYLLERRSQGRLGAILVASEPATTDEPWTPVAEQTLVAIWRRPCLGQSAISERTAGPH